MFAAFAKPIAAGIVLVASGPQLPHFDIESICQTTTTTGRDPVSLRVCRNDEREARDDLLKRWAKIPLRYRQACVGSANDVSPSYVELSTCIQTNLDVDKERAADSQGSSISHRSVR